MSNLRNNLKVATKIIVATLVLVAVVEGSLRVAYLIRNAAVDSIPLPYVIGHNYGPTPPWIDGLRVLEPDNDLIWKNRPNLRRRYVDVFSPVDSEAERTSLLRQFIPSMPASLKANPVWEISLNSRGFRDSEFPLKKPSTAFRIICLGDSWTFGANVGQDQAYPQQLRALLKREFPAASFEVLNLGVMGYTSFQGLELLRRQAIHLEPDLLVIGFAMNDSSVAGYRDKDMPALSTKPTPVERVRWLITYIESYKLARYLTDVAKHKPVAIGARLKANGKSSDEETALSLEKMYADNEPWTRVSLVDYEKNLLAMIKLARDRGAGVILLNNQLWPESPYTPILKRISQAENVPLVDSNALVEQARSKIEQDIETKLGLERRDKLDPQGNSGDVEVIFRVNTENRSVPKSMYIAGPSSQLGASVPNRIRMYDDGTHGDQRAGDKVWSYTAVFPQKSKISYVYTNSGREGNWEGLDVPQIRTFRTGSRSGKIYTPVDNFGTIYMQADSWHTNAAGYQLIVKAVFESLQKDAKFKSYIPKS